MTDWLQFVARLNPLTYLVELLRRLLLDIGPEQVAHDVTILVAGTVVAVAIASRLYSRRLM